MALAAMAVAFAASVSAPSASQPDGSRLVTTAQCFAIERAGTLVGHTSQKVEAASADGRPAWRIIIHQRLANGRFDLRDELLVDRASLLPISLKSQRGATPESPGWQRITIAYGPAGISGTRETATGTSAIAAKPEGPVWDGNLWGLTFAALPLAPGRQFTLPIWQYDKGFGQFTVRVVGETMVSTASGPVSAWQLDAGDNPANLVRYHIAKMNGLELGYSAGPMVQRLSSDCPPLP